MDWIAQIRWNIKEMGWRTALRAEWQNLLLFLRLTKKQSID